MNIQLLDEMELKANEQGAQAFKRTFSETKDANQAAKAQTEAIVKATNEFKVSDFTASEEDFNEMKNLCLMGLKEELRGR